MKILNVKLQSVRPHKDGSWSFAFKALADDCQEEQARIITALWKEDIELDITLDPAAASNQPTDVQH